MLYDSVSEVKFQRIIAKTNEVFISLDKILEILLVGVFVDGIVAEIHSNIELSGKVLKVLH